MQQRVSIKMEQFSGMLVVNKPRGMISKDVSRWLVTRLGKQKLGHVGTLDPNAEGILPLVFGAATRLQDYLLEMPKTYEFDLTFGAETDSLDSDGEVVRTAPWDHLTTELILREMGAFRGPIEQIPPLYSAVKFKGKPLYEYARKDRSEEVPLSQLVRKVVVHRFDLVGYENGVGRFIMTCSRGTYVRSVVKGLADAMGTCGTLTRLLRTHAAGVGLDESWTLPQIEERLDDFRSLLVPVQKIGLGMPRWLAPDEFVSRKLRSGSAVRVEPSAYAESFDKSEKPMVPSALRQSIVLVDDVGNAFGLGDACLDEHGRVTVSMRRGLQ